MYSENENRFSKGFIKILERTIEFENIELAKFIGSNKEEIETLDDLSYFITKLVKKINKKVVLMISSKLTFLKI